MLVKKENNMNEVKFNPTWIKVEEAMRCLMNMDTWQNEIDRHPEDSAAAEHLRDAAWRTLRHTLDDLRNSVPRYE